jgi:gliding motility-associated-like protein
MEHSYVGDFTIKLISPNGSITVLLADENDVDVGNGLISHDLGEPNVTTTGPTLCDPASNPPGVGYIYCWSPNPTVTSTWHELNTAGTLNSPIDASVIATNTNIYKAYDDSFNQILNTPLNGDWTIEVTDSYENDNGWIFQWWIDFNPEITPTSWSFNNYIVDEYFLPEPSIISNNDSSITIEPEPGIHNYSYEVVDNFNCTYSDEITITTPPYVVAYFMQNQDTVVYNNGLVKFTNFSSPDPQTNLVFNQWSFGDGQSSTEEQPKHDFNQIGTYSVQLTVTNEIGCADSYSSEVVAIEDYFVWTPTAFTPNGDGTNDIYKPILKNIIESSFELFIYDRWGKLVYQSNEINSGWNGIRQDNGISAESSSYSFVMRFISHRDIEEKTGLFVLLK